VRDEIDASVYLSVFFESGFIIDECDDDFSIFWNIGTLNEDEITIFYTFLIHRVSLSSKEEVFIGRGEELRRDRNLGLDIFFCKYRHPAGDSTDERNAPYFVTIGRILRRYADVLEGISVEPSFLHDLIEQYADRPGRSISESSLECSYGDLLSFSEIFSDFLEEELFFGSEILHKRVLSEEYRVSRMECVKHTMYTKRVYMYAF